MKTDIDYKIGYIYRQYRFEEIFDISDISKFGRIHDFMLDVVKRYRPETNEISACSGSFLVDGKPLNSIRNHEVLVEELYDFLLFNQ